MTIEILPQSEQQILAIAISDKLSESDYDDLRPEMDLRADKFDSFDLLVDISELGSFEPSVIRQELEFAKDYTSDIGHMALVSDMTLWNSLTEFVGKPFGAVLGVELEHFDERSVAMAWLTSQRS